MPSFVVQFLAAVAFLGRIYSHPEPLFIQTLFSEIGSITDKAMQKLTPKTMGEMVLPKGYPLEEHTVTTEDGYILTMHRIPYAKNAAPSPNPPLLLQAGLLCSSAAWVLSTEEKGLGFILAEAGYDVWMGNNRGNTFGEKHIKWKPNRNSKQFWDFSFHEMGIYDLPAMIDYILAKTNSSQLYYVGHSQGTTQFYAMASMKPEYNKKVIAMSSLAPIAYLSGTRGVVNIITKFTPEIQLMSRLANVHNVMSDNFFTRIFEQAVCLSKAPTRVFCDNLLFLVAGYDSDQLNITLVPTIAHHFPAGASIKQLIHYGQLANNGHKFTQFDYGSRENLKRYGSSTPPEYDLSKITTPVILHYSNNDWLSSVEDVDYLYSKLTNSPRKQKVEVPFEYFNHLDFMWAIDVNPLLYDDVIRILATFKSSSS